ECPELARVAIGLQDDSLTLSEAGREPLSVAPRAPGIPRSVCIWRDTVSAFDQGEDAAQWLTSFLHRPARLMRFDRSNALYCDPQYAGESGAKTLFADGYPVLIVNEASLAELNGKMAQPLPITRFRPNVVLS